MPYFVAAFLATLGLVAALSGAPFIAMVLKAAAFVALIVIVAAILWMRRRV